jgi:hypothetical protein
VGLFLLLALAALVVAFYVSFAQPNAERGTAGGDSTASTRVVETTPIAAEGVRDVPPGDDVDEPPLGPSGVGPTVLPTRPTVPSPTSAPGGLLASEVATESVTLPPRATLAPVPTPLPPPTPLLAAAGDLPENAPVASTPTASIPEDARVALLTPVDGSVVSGDATFAWQANFSLASNQAFELIFWKLGENPFVSGLGWGGHSRAPQTSVNLQVDAVIAGEYRWGVRLVQVEPYLPLRFLGGNYRVTIAKQTSEDDGICTRLKC